MSEMPGNFLEAMRNLNPNPPLRGKEIEEFYVHRPDNPYKYWINNIYSEKNAKLPVTGPIGVGKSTELNRIIKDLQEEFLVISPEQEDLQGREGMGYVSFLILLIREMMKIVGDWSKFGIFGLNPVFANYQYEKAYSKERFPDHREILNYPLSEETEKTLYDFLRFHQEKLFASLSLIKNYLEEEHKKKIIFIFDDLEKLEKKVVEDIYISHGKEIKNIPFTIIFTYPIELSYNMNIRIMQDLYEKPLYLFPVSVEGRNGKPNNAGMEFFQKVLNKRAPDISFQPGVVEKMALSSGGLIRTFLHLARNSVRNAKMDEDDMVRAEHLERELLSARESFFRIITEDEYDKISKYTILQDAVVSGMEKFISKDIILEHHDEEGIWYQINPIIDPLVKKFIIRRDKEKEFNKRTY